MRALGTRDAGSVLVAVEKALESGHAVVWVTLVSTRDCAAAGSVGVGGQSSASAGRAVDSHPASSSCVSPQADTVRI